MCAVFDAINNNIKISSEYFLHRCLVKYLHCRNVIWTRVLLRRYGTPFYTYLQCFVVDIWIYRKWHLTDENSMILWASPMVSTVNRLVNEKPRVEHVGVCLCTICFLSTD